jgi:hypothetical protein
MLEEIRYISVCFILFYNLCCCAIRFHWIIRNICELIFGGLNPLERLHLFTTPHVTRLMDILRQFSPDKFDKSV